MARISSDLCGWPDPLGSVCFTLPGDRDDCILVTPTSVNASCDDSELCSFDRCIDNLCFYDLDAKYGDVVGVGGVCGPNGEVTLLDTVAVLNGFRGQFAAGCELVNMDIAGNAGFGLCDPNGIINLFDILAVLDAFQGLDRCCAEPE